MESRFSGAKDYPVFYRAWLPEKADRLLLLVHGLGEHSGRYDTMGAWFAEHGYAEAGRRLRAEGHAAVWNPLAARVYEKLNAKRLKAIEDRRAS